MNEFLQVGWPSFFWLIIVGARYAKHYSSEVVQEQPYREYLRWLAVIREQRLTFTVFAAFCLILWVFA